MKKHFCHSFLLFLLTSLMTLSGSVYAHYAQTSKTQTKQQTAQTILTQIEPLKITQTQYEALTAKQQKTIAKMWGLKPKEYQRYLNLMTNTPSGKWYQQLDPPEVLGINARNPKEQMYYAKLVVRFQHFRVSRELAFQRAYDRAQKILYPNLKPIMVQ